MKLKGWVARDGDYELCLYEEYPARGNKYWEVLGDFWQLPPHLFPSLTWEDEPIEVEITIQEVK